MQESAELAHCYLHIQFVKANYINEPRVNEWELCSTYFMEEMSHLAQIVEGAKNWVNNAIFHR